MNNTFEFLGQKGMLQMNLSSIAVYHDNERYPWPIHE